MSRTTRELTRLEKNDLLLVENMITAKKNKEEEEKLMLHNYLVSVRGGIWRGM